jgi:sulfate permease, SulP family
MCIYPAKSGKKTSMNVQSSRTSLSLSAFLTFGAATLVVGLDSIGFTIALATLIFSGDLSPGLSMGVSAALASAAILTITVGVLSSFKTNIAGVQDIGAAILAVALSAQLAGVSQSEKVPTAFAVVALATFATGALFCLVGLLKAGRLVRFFPLEVLAGFLAATGCVLLLGGVSTVAHVPADVSGLLSLRHFDQFIAVALAFAVAFTIYFVLRKFRNPFALLSILFTAALLFHGWRWLQGFSLSDLAARGFLPVVNGVDDVALPFPQVLSAINWEAVLAASPTIATVAMLSMFATLLNLSALEVAAGTEFDFDKELVTTGLGNIAAAGAGGSPGYTNLSMTLLLKKFGISSRHVAFGVTTLLLLGLVFAPKIITLVPTFVTAALVLYFGIDLVHDWLLSTRQSFKPREWMVVLIIVLLSLFYSLMFAIVVGFLMATVLFAYSYAHAPVVRTETTLAQLPSTTDRSPEATALLRDQANKIRIFQLQGFLFFGTSEKVLSRLRDAARHPTKHTLEHVIIDFSRVTEMDSASANAFKRILSLSKASRFTIAFSGLSPSLASTLAKAGVIQNLAEGVSFSADLDLALVDAEETLLTNQAPLEHAKSLAVHFAKSEDEQQRLLRLFTHMQRETHAAGSRIIAAGDTADKVYFIESGCAEVQRILLGGTRKRLRTMSPGAIVGDVAFSIGGTRTADVVATSETVSLSISASDVDNLAKHQPDLALLFNRLLARALAEKVITANRMTEQVS